ncbi:MAG: hypothetical protein LBF83_02130, partial [Spirochaetaceae bacterium]|nr:hypothetical protein [Spirochaetaceae bacterium]
TDSFIIPLNNPSPTSNIDSIGDDGGLTTSATVGIVFASIGTLLMIVGIVIFLVVRKFHHFPKSKFVELSATEPEGYEMRSLESGVTDFAGLVDNRDFPPAEFLTLEHFGE